MKRSRIEWVLFALFVACLASWFVVRADWLVTLSFILAAPMMWLALSAQWKRLNG